jgi:hypothetical protein
MYKSSLVCVGGDGEKGREGGRKEGRRSSHKTNKRLVVRIKTKTIEEAIRHCLIIRIDSPVKCALALSFREEKEGRFLPPKPGALILLVVDRRGLSSFSPLHHPPPNVIPRLFSRRLHTCAGKKSQEGPVLRVAWQAQARRSHQRCCPSKALASRYHLLHTTNARKSKQAPAAAP